MSFRYKIALTIFCVAAVIIFIVLWGSLSYVKHSLWQELHYSNRILVQSLVNYSAKEALMNEEYGTIQVELEEVVKQSSIDTIVLLDASKRVLAANDLTLVGGLFTQSPDRQWYGESIRSGGAVVGQVAYSYTGERVEAATLNALEIGLIMSAVGVLIIAGVGVFIGTMLADRLERISTSTEEISKGEWDAITVDTANDEVGKLSRFIHQLAHQQRDYIAELELSRERTRLALEVGGVAAWSWDYSTKELTWSAKYYHSLGILPDSATPSYKLWLSRVHPEDRDYVEKAVAQMIRNNKHMDIEFRIIRPTGSLHWMHNIARIQFDREGKPLEIYGLQIDITRFKQARGR